MARNNGDLWLFKLADSGEVELNIGYATSASINFDVNLIDTSNKNSSRWEEHILGNRSVEISFEGLHDATASDNNLYSTKEIIEAITNGTEIDFIFGPESGTGQYNITGSGNISNLSLDTPHDGAVTYSGTLVVTGSVTVTTL